MENRNNSGYMPYNEETYYFDEYRSSLRRLNLARNITAGADAALIILCLILFLPSFAYTGVSSFVYIIRAALAAASIVAGTLFRLNTKANGIVIGAEAACGVISLAIGASAFSVFMYAWLLVCQGVLTYLGICEKPLSEKVGYPYFNRLSYENAQKKEYIPDHKIYESRGSMDEINTEGIAMDEITSDISGGEYNG